MLSSYLMRDHTRLSIVIPVYNEEKNLPALFAAFAEILPKTGHEYEIIAVNDGSRDDSLRTLRAYAAKDKRVKVVDFRFNCGQTAALSAGISHPSGMIVIPMDN